MEKTLLDIALILVFTKIGGILSRKIKMPEVLGSLVAGLILGPIVLNLVQYDNNIKLLANLGVILLMFLAGLETNLDEMKKAGFTSFMIAMAGVVLPLILGTMSAYLFFPNFWENLFVGVILTATSVSISVETLKELGKLNSRAGINILGAAVIDDVLGLVLISIVLAVANSYGVGNATSGDSNLVLVIANITLFCLFSILGIMFLPKYINKFFNSFKHHSNILPICIACGILMAFVAEYLGIAAITGAYICGLILSTYTHKEHIERNIKAISSGFLSLIFFASVGIEASIEGLTPKVLLITLVMFLVAVIGKIIGCGGAARLLKLTKNESIQIGTGMISRGEVAIITANIGLQKGIISDEIFVPTLIVVILSTIITPVLLKFAFSLKNPKHEKVIQQ
jgi:Kef-type K+ transport system membrane component KefB